VPDDLLLARLITGPQTRWAWFWTGIAMGGLSLTRENALVFVGVTLLWALVGVTSTGLSIRNTAVVAGGDAYRRAGSSARTDRVVLPVAVRNSVVGGGFYLTTSQFGPNSTSGNNARADGTYMSLRFGEGTGVRARGRDPACGRGDRSASVAGRVSSYWTKRRFRSSGRILWRG